MYFDRFDICEAYYLFACHWHAGQSSKEYRIFGRLEKIRFKPSFNLGYNSLSENGQAIYHRLVGKAKGLPEYYEPCGECGYDHSYEQDEASKTHQAIAQADTQAEE